MCFLPLSPIGFQVIFAGLLKNFRAFCRISSVITGLPFMPPEEMCPKLFDMHLSACEALKVLSDPFHPGYSDLKCHSHVIARSRSLSLRSPRNINRNSDDLCISRVIIYLEYVVHDISLKFSQFPMILFR